MTTHPENHIPLIGLVDVIQFWCSNAATRQLVLKYNDARCISQQIEKSKESVAAGMIDQAACGSEYQRRFAEAATRFDATTRNLFFGFILFCDSATFYHSKQESVEVLSCTSVEWPLGFRCSPNQPTIAVLSVALASVLRHHGYELWWNAITPEVELGQRGINVYMDDEQPTKAFWSILYLIGDNPADRKSVV